MIYVAAWFICTLVLKLFFGFRSYGRRNIPASGGVILAVNHQSYLDPVVVGCGLFRRVHFMARESLFRGAFAWLIRRLGAFPVQREEADRRAVKEFLGRIEGGKVVMLFPEGTRTPDGRLQPLKGGVGALAVRAACAIVPTYIDGTFRAWPRHRALPGRARIGIYYGRPFVPERLPEESRRAYGARIRGTIAARLAGLERIARARGACRPRRGASRSL